MMVMLRRKKWKLPGFGDPVVVVGAEKEMEKRRRSELRCCVQARKLLPQREAHLSYHDNLP